MDITCVSDLHGNLPPLPGGDLLIVAGDLTAKEKLIEYMTVFSWAASANYRKKILIAGNHDNFLERDSDLVKSVAQLDYLQDSGTEFEGLKIWGSPWTHRFPRQKPYCRAFTVKQPAEMIEKWKLIPNDTDILVTHGPARGILDLTYNLIGHPSVRGGCKFLEKRMAQLKVKLHVFGHVHEGYGIKQNKQTLMWSVNAAHLNWEGQPVNPPIRLNL